MASDRPNLLFMMTDHQRYDSLGMVQAGIEVTPNLNRLAAQGAYFTRAYNTCPLCVPARTALFTGVYPTRNGMVYNEWSGELAGDFKPFMQHLSEAGYEVAHVGVDHVRVNPPLRERVPFDLWVDRSDHSAYIKEQELTTPKIVGAERFTTEVVEHYEGEESRHRYSSPNAEVWPLPTEHFLDSYWARRAEEFIRRDHDRPFALFLFLWSPHPPLVVPEPYASMFDPDALELPANVGVPAEGEPPRRRRGVAGQLGDAVPSMDEWRRAWAAHLGLVNLSDMCLGGVMAALEESGHASNTVTVFTIDHGDHLGQHRMYQKMEMYDQAIRVPLIFRVPGLPPRTFDTPVSHLDVVPTLLDPDSRMLAGCGQPGGQLDGRSLWSAVDTGTEPPARPVFCQYSGTLMPNDIRRAVISGRYKYVYDPNDEPELLDLEADPLEMTNLAKDPACADVVKEMHELCRMWHTARGDWIDY